MLKHANLIKQYKCVIDYASRPSPPLQFVRIDSDDEGKCEELLFPGEGEVTDAAVVLLRKKMSGKYTLFKVSQHSSVRTNCV